LRVQGSGNRPRMDQDARADHLRNGRFVRSILRAAPLPGRHHPLMHESALAAALRRDRWIVAIALLAITALALGYTCWLATGFDMSAMMSPGYVPWTAGYFAFMALMW